MDFSDGQALQRFAREVALELPDAVLTHPFGPQYDVLKVAGKMFALTLDHTGAHVSLKARPADSLTLREQFSTITTGYHLNKKHWISIYPGPGIDGQLVEDLVIESYLLVRAGLPRDRRPVLPDELRGHSL